MYEEQRLTKLGYPLEDAVSLCHSLRREGTLEEFVAEEEAGQTHCHCGGDCQCGSCKCKK